MPDEPLVDERLNSKSMLEFVNPLIAEEFSVGRLTDEKLVML
jgi:hypothetical protein